MAQSFCSLLHKTTRLYDACGNIIGIVPLGQIGYDGNFKKDSALRSFLCEWSKRNNCDSIMVLLGRPELKDVQGYHVRMYVFEPKGTDDSGLAGGISTMCGNGVRAVAQFIHQMLPYLSNFQIMTESGMREVLVKGNSQYQVNMGNFFSHVSVLSRYIDINEIQSINGCFIDSPIPQNLKRSINAYIPVSTWSIGLNGDTGSNGSVDGEPHVVIFLNQDIQNINQLRAIAKQVGPLITKNFTLFPHEINVNLVSIIDSIDNKDEFSILLCTHERNLGDDPDHSVTAACGTGSTVVGALLFRKFGLSDKKNVSIYLPGGKLIINKRKDNLFMTGPVRCLL